MLVPAHRWESSSQPHSLITRKAKPVFLPFEPFSDLLGSLPCVPPRSPHCVSNKLFHHVLDIVWGHQSWHPKQNFGRTTHSILSPKPQFIPRQTVGSMKLGFRIIWAALIESVANWKISGFSIPKVINQLRIEIQLSFPFLFLKLTIRVYNFHLSIPKLGESPHLHRATTPISLQVV